MSEGRNKSLGTQIVAVLTEYLVVFLLKSKFAETQILALKQISCGILLKISSSKTEILKIRRNSALIILTLDTQI